MRHVLLTGATGLVGGAVLRRLLARNAALRVAVVVRSPARWLAHAAREPLPLERIRMLQGDVTMAGLGLTRSQRAHLRTHVDTLIHCAGDVTFSNPLPAARAANVEGTRNVLDVAAGSSVQRVVHMSTAFVCGTRTGHIAEDDVTATTSWVNAYEQSKFEAELLVRSFDRPWVILRPSTIVCDDVSGHITQLNSVHRALRVLHAGLAPMLPGTEDAPLDVVTASYVADATARIALDPAVARRALHLCAGSGAIRLGELLDRTFAFWSRDADWRRRSVTRPALASLETYNLFERAVEELDNERLRAITRSFTHFVPQLALPKQFDTANSDRLLGFTAAAVETFWETMLSALNTRHARKWAAA